MCPPSLEQRFEATMRAIQGALIAASSLQIVLGFCGIWRIFMRFFLLSNDGFSELYFLCFVDLYNLQLVQVSQPSCCGSHCDHHCTWAFLLWLPYCKCPFFLSFHSLYSFSSYMKLLHLFIHTYRLQVALRLGFLQLSCWFSFHR